MTNATKPGVFAEVITPNDSTVFQRPTRGVLIESSADLAVLMAGDTSSVVIKGLVAGVFHPLSVQKILSTGTGTTNQITVLY